MLCRTFFFQERSCLAVSNMHSGVCVCVWTKCSQQLTSKKNAYVLFCVCVCVCVRLLQSVMTDRA